MAFRPNAMHDLAAAHARLFRKPPVIMSHLPAGWLRLVDQLCTDIENELGDELFRVAQLKEEAGILRFSFELSGRGDTLAEFLAARNDGVLAVAPATGLKMGRIRKLIAEAAERSTTLCAQCGAPGSVESAGAWHVPLCERHKEAR